MTEMVERGALAVRTVINDPEVMEKLLILRKASTSEHVENWMSEQVARAVIAAMREPTEAMYDAVSATGKMWRETNSTEIWRTMIDGALKDEKKP